MQESKRNLVKMAFSGEKPPGRSSLDYGASGAY